MHFTCNNSFNPGNYLMACYAQITDKETRHTELDNEQNWNEKHDYKNK